MDERITLVSLFDNYNINKIIKYINLIDEPTCKVPYGKNVKDRFLADTLPYHFTLFSWDIKKEKDVISILENIEFKPCKILIDTISVVNSSEDSYILLFNIVKNDELYKLQKEISKHFSSKYYNPDTFNFHITIDISKDKKKIIREKKIIESLFVPFELEVTSV